MNATPAMIQAVVSLGTNIEPRAQRLADALAALAALPQTHLVKVSSVRETEPVDVPAAFRDQRFLNQIAVCETAHGRVRGPVRNMPRTIDLDLIAVGDLVLDEADLTLPHPRARQRAFVLEPLAEVLPGFRWPDMI